MAIQVLVLVQKLSLNYRALNTQDSNVDGGSHRPDYYQPRGGFRALEIYGYGDQVGCCSCYQTLMACLIFMLDSMMNVTYIIYLLYVSQARFTGCLLNNEPVELLNWILLYFFSVHLLWVTYFTSLHCMQTLKRAPVFDHLIWISEILVAVAPLLWKLLEHIDDIAISEVALNPLFCAGMVYPLTSQWLGNKLSFVRMYRWWSCRLSYVLWIQQFSPPTTTPTFHTTGRHVSVVRSRRVIVAWASLVWW